MIVLVTDFGLSGPYTGQMKAVLTRAAPGVPIVDLFADSPAFDPRPTAYLLAAYSPYFPGGAVFLCVVDPGVGSGRLACIVRAQDQWFVGPDNGLFDVVCRRATESAAAWRIDWRPERSSASFHGRDLFAPVAARIACGDPPPGSPLDVASIRRPSWPDDLAEVVYVDVYGNAITGLRAAVVPREAVFRVGEHRLHRARTFSDRPVGEAFWYENANGLVEIAVNRGRAADVLGLRIGASVHCLET